MSNILSRLGLAIAVIITIVLVKCLFLSLASSSKPPEPARPVWQSRDWMADQQALLPRIIRDVGGLLDEDWPPLAVGRAAELGLAKRPVRINKSVWVARFLDPLIMPTYTQSAYL